MKAVKRQTRSREIEAEQNEVNERKKARLSNENKESDVSTRKKSVECDVTPKKKNDASADIVNNGPETNGNSDGTFEIVRISTKISEPKTSTPIIENGLNNFSSKFHTSSPLPEAIPFLGPDVIEDSELNDSAMPEQNANTEPISDAETESPDAANVSHDMDCMEESVTNTEKPPEDITEEMDAQKDAPTALVEPGTSKCDVEFFLSSLLQAYQLKGHSHGVLTVAADGNLILSAGNDTTIKMWDSHKKTEICNFQGHTGPVTAIILLTTEQTAKLAAKANFSNVTRIVISGSSDCSIRLWSVSEGVELLSIYTYNGITSLDYLQDRNCVAVGTDGGKLELWDLCSSKILHSVIAHEGAVKNIKIDDDFIYTISDDGKVKVWLFEDDELQVIYSRFRKSPAFPSGEMKPTAWKSVACHENMMYLGDDTSDIKVLDWKAGRLRMMRNQVQPNGLILAMCAKNNILLSSSFDAYKNCGAINVWQLPSMSYICTMSGHVGKIESLALTETEDGILRVVSGGPELIVWDYICAKRASPGDNDKFYCRELERIGDDTSLESEEKSKPKVSDAPKTGDDTSRSWNCTFL